MRVAVRKGQTSISRNGLGLDTRVLLCSECAWFLTYMNRAEQKKKTVQSRIEQSRADQNKTENSRAEQIRTVPNRAEHSRTEQKRAEQIRSE